MPSTIVVIIWSCSSFLMLLGWGIQNPPGPCPTSGAKGSCRTTDSARATFSARRSALSREPMPTARRPCDGMTWRWAMLRKVWWNRDTPKIAMFDEENQNSPWFTSEKTATPIHLRDVQIAPGKLPLPLSPRGCSPLAWGMAPNRAANLATPASQSWQPSLWGASMVIPSHCRPLLWEVVGRKKQTNIYIYIHIYGLVFRVPIPPMVWVPR